MGGNIRDYSGEGKWLKISGKDERWCQVLEGIFDALGVIEEIKSPCVGRGFWS